MLINNLKQVYFANKDKNPLLVRNLLKESLQCKNEAFERLKEKVKVVTPKFLKQDLLPFIENPASVKSFADNFQTIVNQNIQKIY
ncbi:MAG: hypothetical protein ABH819_02750 [Patescibacteria group bacterium]|nr:hypothetical protein [Patescibacteria group bacterium]